MPLATTDMKPSLHTNLMQDKHENEFNDPNELKWKKNARKLQWLNDDANSFPSLPQYKQIFAFWTRAVLLNRFQNLMQREYDIFFCLCLTSIV